MSWQAIRDFLITVFFLGLAFILALLSSVAAERNDIKHAAIAAAVSLVLALLGALYIIPRLARNVRLEILRFAVRTTVTVEGLLFIVFLAVIAFAAWNTGNNLLYLILSAMLSFLIAANLIARLTLADVSVQLRFPDHIFAGEPSNLAVTIINHKRLMPSYSLSVEALAESNSETADDEDTEESKETTKYPRSGVPSANGELKRQSRSRVLRGSNRALGGLAYFVLAPARASARQRVEHTFDRRGRYPITGFRISTKFPAGFFKKWRNIDASGELLVYPKPRPLDDFYHALPMLAGRIESQARGFGDDLYAIRRYHPSDHMRHIDWKATAKSLEMMVREHMREDEWRLTIVFDCARPQFFSNEMRHQSAEMAEPASRERAERDENESPTPRSDSFDARFERAVVMAASLANHFILERADVELITQDAEHNVAPGSGHDHLYKILRSLATLQTLDDDSDPNSSSPIGKRRLFGWLRKNHAEESFRPLTQASNNPGGPAWRLLDEMPVLGDDRRFKVLITSAAKGTIPANVWRSAHVVFMEDI
jgi:uncharacterized protein (DUF58 family)